MQHYRIRSYERKIKRKRINLEVPKFTMKEFKEERIGQQAIFAKLMTENFYLLKENMSPYEMVYELPNKSKMIIIHKYMMTYCRDILEFKDKMKLLKTL